MSDQSLGLTNPVECQNHYPLTEIEQPRNVKGFDEELGKILNLLIGRERTGPDRVPTNLSTQAGQPGADGLTVPRQPGSPAHIPENSG